MILKKDSKKAKLFMELLKPEKNIEKISELLSGIDEKKITESFYI